MGRPTVLYHLLKEISLILDVGDRQVLAAYDLSVPRFLAIYHLGEQPGLSVSELSDEMLCDKSNVTRLVKGMEREGLVERRRHETDGRKWLLFLTARGEATLEEVLRAHREQNQKRFAAFLQDDEGEALVGVLQDLRYCLHQEPGTTS